MRNVGFVATSFVFVPECFGITWVLGNSLVYVCTLFYPISRLHKIREVETPVTHQQDQLDLHVSECDDETYTSRLRLCRALALLDFSCTSQMDDEGTASPFHLAIAIVVIGP